VKYRHFEAFRPVCPVCRDSESQTAFPLRLASVLRTRGETVLEGTLHCTNPACLREYPIIDGIPIIVPAIRSYVSENLLAILSRTDLTEPIESLLGDCCGPGSPFDTIRQQISSYAWDHYGGLDPAEAYGQPGPGATARLLTSGLQALGEKHSGPVLDVGCSVGGSTFALAQATNELVLGVDLNFAMLRIAAEVLHHEVVRYARRRVGVVYDRREFPASFKKRDAVDFWACDASALPLEDGLLGLSVSLNLLDSIRSPVDHLRTLARTLAPGGKALIGCPYDWSTSVTPLEAWLGGHSQRGPAAGASEPVLRSLLADGAHPGSIPGLAVIAELDGLPWHVRLHDRSTMVYQIHLVAAESTAASQAPAECES
jgi:SAM-dependent methyltransferase